MPDLDRKRLFRIAGLLTSDKIGERAAAAAMPIVAAVIAVG